MIIINMSHPLTEEQLAQLEALAGQPAERVIPCPVQFDAQQPFAPQVQALVAGVGLSAEEWQTLPILLNPPALNWIAVAVLAELHGRMGHFPAVLRLRPVNSSVPTRYEVAEVLDLEGIRDSARTTRKGDK